jgi:hypothetical protein
LKDVSTHQRDLDLEKRASRNLGFSPSDLKSLGQISRATLDEMRWGWSGLKGLNEIYNFRLEAEGKK